MLKQLKQNQKGVVFVTVLMIIIVMMVLSVSVISLNVSQVMLSENESKRIQAEILAMGALSYMFANQMSSSPSNLITDSVILDNITYNIISNVANPGGGTYGTSELNIDVVY